MSDTGIGIEPDVLPRIFDPFEQGETTITRQFGGLGLGLAICKALVEAHGGRLAADERRQGPGDDVPGRCSRPLPDAGRSSGDGEPRRRPPRAAAHRPVAPLRILLVEDDAGHRRG